MKSQPQPTATNDELTGWFLGKLPDDLFAGPPTITGDEDEVLIVGPIADVDIPKDATEATQTAARQGRVSRFREETREQRMRVAAEAEHLFGRKVSWGAELAGERYLFSTLGLPVMTRLRLDSRKVLDTLIDAGVARSRSEALAWCVRLVGKHQEEWLESLRGALTKVEEVRSQGPD